MNSHPGSSTSNSSFYEKSTPSDVYEKSPERAEAQQTHASALVVPQPQLQEATEQEALELTSDSDSHSSSRFFSSEGEQETRRPYRWGDNRESMEDIYQHPSSYDLCVDPWVSFWECAFEISHRLTARHNLFQAYESVRGEMEFADILTKTGTEFVRTETTARPDEEMLRLFKIGELCVPYPDEMDIDADDDEEGEIILHAYKWKWSGPDGKAGESSYDEMDIELDDNDEYLTRLETERV
ncbi:hypothetical protein F5B22DRAFT_84663 [Xylaria bambusicola]|uniref:uncharacterized protein n=1 Tax=Xylaria bambusicola TaxID=326684 RepID=UPI002007AC18|nr:uncharacterized protein F5B22DRAFT_84663 [Xylaria bambusicola]KAI0517939.1 hypothetical protein F5B22DRAFT_84663 [Xylaria bambusicola]